MFFPILSFQLKEKIAASQPSATVSRAPRSSDGSSDEGISGTTGAPGLRHFVDYVPFRTLCGLLCAIVDTLLYHVVFLDLVMLCAIMYYVYFWTWSYYVLLCIMCYYNVIIDVVYMLV